MQDKFTIGIEEEYLLVDVDSYKLAAAPDALMDACKGELQEQVSPEFLKCQIEVGTKVCETVDEARADLKKLRSCIATEAKKHNLAPLPCPVTPFRTGKTSISPTATAIPSLSAS